jgi:hypothetical protein
VPLGNCPQPGTPGWRQEQQQQQQQQQQRQQVDVKDSSASGELFTTRYSWVATGAATAAAAIHG